MNTIKINKLKVEIQKTKKKLFNLCLECCQLIIEDTKENNLKKLK